MTEHSEEAAGAVARLLSRRPPKERPDFLLELLAHSAAGLVVIEGGPKAAEAVYRIADAIAAPAPQNTDD